MGYNLIDKEVIVFEFGEPRIKNIIGYNEITQQYQLQTEGSFGYYWCGVEKFVNPMYLEYVFRNLSNIKKESVAYKVISIASERNLIHNISDKNIEWTEKGSIWATNF